MGDPTEVKLTPVDVAQPVDAIASPLHSVAADIVVVAAADIEAAMPHEPLPSFLPTDTVVAAAAGSAAAGSGAKMAVGGIVASLPSEPNEGERSYLARLRNAERERDGATPTSVWCTTCLQDSSIAEYEVEAGRSIRWGRYLQCASCRATQETEASMLGATAKGVFLPLQS
jgi:hypothetical protein